MTKRQRGTITGILLLAILLTFAATGSAATQLRFAIIQDEGTLNPYTYRSGYPGQNLMLLVFDTLMQIDAEGIPQPWLAKTVEPSEGGKVWRMTLDEKAKWHDSKPLTADDVRFTYEYVVTKEGNHSRWTSPSKEIEKIETPDAQTVIFTLKKPNPSFSIRPLADVPIMPKHIWTGVTEPKTFENNIGSGPYKVAQIDKDKFYKLEANPDYFKGKPAVDTLFIEIIKDTNALYTALESGQIDATSRALQPELVSKFQSNSALKTIQGPSFTSSIVLFNLERAPYSDKAFRQAVDFAVDKKKLVDTLLLGQGVVATGGFVHPDLAWADKDLKPAYDQAKAKELLDGLGMKDADGDGYRELKDGAKLDIQLLAGSNSPIRIRAAEMIAADLKTVGIKVTVKSTESTTLDDLVWKEYDVSKGRNFDMAMFGWSAPIQADPGRLRDLVHSDHAKGTINLGAYKSSEADDLADKLAQESDPAKRYDLNRQLQKVVDTDVPILTLWFPLDTFAYNPKAHDGWVYTKGQGIVSKLSFLSTTPTSAPAASTPAGQTEPKPVEEPQVATASRSSGLVWFGGGALVLIAAVVAMRRRKGAAS